MIPVVFIYDVYYQDKRGMHHQQMLMHEMLLKQNECRAKGWYFACISRAYPPCVLPR